MVKVDLLQEQARKLLNYILRGGSGKPYTHDELATELNVDRSLVTHMVNGSKEIELSKILKLEELAKVEILDVLNPKKLQVKENRLLLEKFYNLDYFPILIERIKSSIKEKHPQVIVEQRNTDHYLSLNVFGSTVRNQLHKNNLHLLFFKYVENDGDPICKIEVMISDALLRASLLTSPWFNDFLKSYKPDNANVTDFINGKPVINKNRPVFKVKRLSSPEMESISNLALAVFEIQCGLVK